jgi:hypothetical protein
LISSRPINNGCSNASIIEDNPPVCGKIDPIFNAIGSNATASVVVVSTASVVVVAAGASVVVVVSAAVVVVVVSSVLEHALSTSTNPTPITAHDLQLRAVARKSLVI